MGDPDYSVQRLVSVHHVAIEGRTVECEPLLLQLWEARFSSLGAGSARGGGSGDLLNHAAIDAYEVIDGRVRAWLDHFGQVPVGSIFDLVPRLLATLRAELAGKRLAEDEGERLLGMFAAAVVQVEEVLDPPHEKELTADCPACGERFEYTHREVFEGQRKWVEMTRVAAVRVRVKAGEAPVARCFCCGRVWSSVDELRALALGMGVEIDFDALSEALQSG